MSIWQNFQDLNLTGDQKVAVEKIESFLQSDTHVFILKGYAGTGKTTLLKGIGEYLKKEHNRLAAVMAPTGRAAKIIKNKTALNASTIHRAIYNFQDLHPLEVENEDGKKSFKFYFGLDINSFQLKSVFIVDESSMIGDNYSEHEFFRFGSGHLLSDLLKFVDVFSKRNHKIIFVGDPAQLEPYGDKFSRALSADYFKDKSISFDKIEMTEVVRQDKDSGILNNATYLRKLLELPKRNENNFNLNYSDTEEIGVEKIADLYTKIAPIPEIDASAIVVFSNDLAHRYNKLIRKEYFPDHKTVIAGDLLLVTKNHYNVNFELFNGEIVKVLWVASEIEPISAPVYINGKKKIISLSFREVELLMPNFDEPVKFKIIDSHLNSRFRDLDSYEMKALYINFVMRFKTRTNNMYDERSEEFKRAIKTDPYFNALQVKYGYALTCHKSQGGEWETTFVDFNGRIGLSDSHIRWQYTAITRASKKLYVLNPSKLSVLSLLKINPIGNIGKVPENMYHFENIANTPFHSQDTHPAKRLKYFEIEEKLKETEFFIEKVESNQYQEVYFIKDEETIYRIDISNNNAGVFTYYTTNSQSEQAKKLVGIFKKKYSLPIEFQYSPSNDTLNKLYQFISSALEESKTKIINVDESKIGNYQVIYYFDTDADCAYIQFYFNGNAQITSAMPKSTLGNNDKQLQITCNSLKNSQL